MCSNPDVEIDPEIEELSTTENDIEMEEIIEIDENNDSDGGESVNDESQIIDLFDMLITSLKGRAITPNLAEKTVL